MKSKNEKKEMIIDAAFQLFIERGYQNTRIVDIASAIDMGKSTFYGYFESKEAIFSELIQSKVRRGCLQDWQKIASLNLPAFKKLEMLLAYDIDFMENSGNFLNFLHEIMISGDVCDKLISKKNFQDILMWRYECLRGIVREGIQSGEFKDMDTDLISLVVMGAFHFFLSAKFHILTDISSDFNSDDLLKVLSVLISPS